MSKNTLYLSVIIPCYNESENLKRGLLNEVFTFLTTLKFSWELIISDDGSSDNCRTFIEAFIQDKKQVSLLKNHHGGKPAAIYQGIQAARGEYILFTDMDQSTPIQELHKILPYLKEYMIVIGSRADRKNFPLYRKIGSKAFKGFRKAILLKDIQDTQCGFKLFHAELLRLLFPKLGFLRKPKDVVGWRVTSFDVELLHLAEVSGHRVKEVLVEWEDRDVTKGKKKSYAKESLEMLVEIIKIKLNDIRGVYK
jgi:dolichyl-phosphate beta-glucosyltransferase